MPKLLLMSVLALFSTSLPSMTADPRYVWKMEREIEGRLDDRALNRSRLKRTLREENIRDQEVKEIQGEVAARMLGDIRHIGPVWAECPCEEGPQCSGQVTVTLSKQERTTGVTFSKLADKWRVSVTEDWDRRYRAFREKYRNYSYGSSAEPRKAKNYVDELQALRNGMPECRGQPTASEPTRPR